MKYKLLLSTAIAIILFTSIAKAVPGDNSITVKILSWKVYPQTVQAGGDVYVDAKIQITMSARNTWDLLVESSVVPQNVPYTFLPFLDVYPHAKCCPGNENFDDAKIEETYSLWHIGFPYTVTEDVHLHLKAPTPSSFDHCSSDPQRSTPGFYWNGEGKYMVTLSVWNGCAKDVKAGLIKYAGDYKFINVYLPSSQSGESENHNIWTRQIANSNFTYSDVLIILGIVGIIIAIFYKERK